MSSASATRDRGGARLHFRSARRARNSCWDALPRPGRAGPAAPGAPAVQEKPGRPQRPRRPVGAPRAELDSGRRQ